MAKVSGPLFSLAASQKLGDALVYFDWKGIKAVRTYVIPVNPQSPLQTAQRDILKAAVAAWHLTKYTANDKTAWDRYAGILAKPMSGFNAFVQTWIELVIGGVAAPNPPCNGAVVNGGAGLFDAGFDEDGTASSFFIRWGYSKTAMNTQVACVEGPANTWIATGVAATVGKRVYVRAFSNDGATVLGWTGIWQYDVV